MTREFKLSLYNGEICPNCGRYGFFDGGCSICGYWDNDYDDR